MKLETLKEDSRKFFLQNNFKEKDKYLYYKTDNYLLVVELKTSFYCEDFFIEYNFYLKEMDIDEIIMQRDPRKQFINIGGIFAKVYFPSEIKSELFLSILQKSFNDKIQPVLDGGKKALYENYGSIYTSLHEKSLVKQALLGEKDISASPTKTNFQDIKEFTNTYFINKGFKKSKNRLYYKTTEFLCEIFLQKSAYGECCYLNFDFYLGENLEPKNLDRESTLYVGERFSFYEGKMCDYETYSEKEWIEIFEKNYNRLILPPILYGKNFLSKEYGYLYTTITKKEETIKALQQE